MDEGIKNVLACIGGGVVVWVTIAIGFLILLWPSVKNAPTGRCSCLEVPGDDPYCPVHEGMAPRPNRDPKELTHFEQVLLDRSSLDDRMESWGRWPHSRHNTSTNGLTIRH